MGNSSETHDSGGNGPENGPKNGPKNETRNEPEKNWRTWYEQFDKNHSPEQRRLWYNDAAKAYRWARPLYPEALIDRVIQKAGLIGHPLGQNLGQRSRQPPGSTEQTTEPSSILEIGCGPGIATASLAKRGFRIQAVEPSAVACAIARERCQAYPQVNIHNSTFEDYPLEDYSLENDPLEDAPLKNTPLKNVSEQQTFDAVLAATSFHWVSPEVACTKSAAALKPGGSLILLWATPPQPTDEVCNHLQAVYESFDLAELGKQQQQRTQAYYQHNFERFARTVADSGLFPLTAVDVETNHSTYSAEKYLALLSTLSPYIALEATLRANLFEALDQALADWLTQAGTDTLEMTHWFADHVAPAL